MRLSAAVVTHRSSGHFPVFVTSLRQEAATVGIEVEIVVAEQSEDAGEAARIAASGADVMLQLPNRGYAAGINAAASAAHADVLLLANPDVELLPGSLQRIVERVRDEPVIAGPQLVWDRAARLLLPPPDDPGPAAALRGAFRRHSRRAWSRTLGGELERAWRLWTATGHVQVPSLRGALLALSVDTWRRVGPLDEGYFLYYEETDWLYSARRCGVPVLLAADARVVHRWGHATEQRPDRAAIAERSRQRFTRRHYGRLFAAFLAWWERRPPVELPTGTRIDGVGDLPDVDADVWLVSPYRHLMPAAGWLARQGVPPEAGSLLGAGTWYAVGARRDAASCWQVVNRSWWGVDGC